MSDYLLIDAAWLEREIGNAKLLREHAAATGKPVAIAAAGVRHESLLEIRKLSVPARKAGEGNIALSIDRAPGAPDPRT